MQLGKQFAPAAVFPRESLERVAHPDPESEDPRWGAELRDFMAHYTEVAQVGHMLLAAPAFEKLAKLGRELEDEFASGGPPLSPVYDSYSVQHLLAEVPQGLAGETPYSVLARLSSGDGARARLCEMARALAASHLDLYRVLEVESLRAQLLPLRGGEAFHVRLSGPFLRRGDVMLARVLAFGSERFIADSPYLLAAPEQEWLDYLQRVAAPGESPSAPASEPARPSHAKLSPKQAARRRKQQKLQAARRAPDEAVVAHLKHGASPRYWLEFIMDGYAGERNGIVLLAGVPDRPHGHALQLATARYAVLDVARARAGLTQSFRLLAGDRFAWMDERGTSLAELELSDTTLIVHVNSLERREAVQARIEAALGTAVRRSLGTLDGDSDALHARVRDGQAQQEPALDLSTLAPEAVQDLHGMLREQIQRGFDSPTPAFKGKTLRQLARGKSRSDAISWLREQERILKRNPQLQGLDMRPLWQELGLSYEGPQAEP